MVEPTSINLKIHREWGLLTYPNLDFAWIHMFTALGTWICQWILQLDWRWGASKDGLTRIQLGIPISQDAWRHKVRQWWLHDISWQNSSHAWFQVWNETWKLEFKFQKRRLKRYTIRIYIYICYPPLESLPFSCGCWVERQFSYTRIFVWM